MSEGPTHGFAVAALTGADGSLGRVWHLPHPMVYRALGRLLDAGLVAVTAVEPGRGPQRHVYTCTPVGARVAEEWLLTPVAHVRDLRSHLLLKLALLQRRGTSPAPLLDAQRDRLRDIVDGLDAAHQRAEGFDATVVAWRRATTVAAVEFLDGLAADREWEAFDGDPERAIEQPLEQHDGPPLR